VTTYRFLETAIGIAFRLGSWRWRCHSQYVLTKKSGWTCVSVK